MKVCLQTSKRLRANLRGGIGSLHANFCPQACKFACKLARGGCKFECKLSGVGLQARVQTGDQAWKLACKLPQHLHSTVGGLKFWSNFARWVEFFMPMHAQGGWNLACKIKREVESFHAILESNLYKIQIRKGLIRRDNCKVKGWAFRQEIDDPGLLS